MLAWQTGSLIAQINGNASRPTYFAPSQQKFMVSTMKRACMNFKTNIAVGYGSPARK